MTVTEKNKTAVVRSTKEVVRKLKVLASVRGNGESLGVLMGALADKELKRLGLEGNNDE